MSGALIALLDGALQSLERPIESTDGEPQAPAELLALAGECQGGIERRLGQPYRAGSDPQSPGVERGEGDLEALTLLAQ